MVLFGLDFGSDWFASTPETTVHVLLFLLRRLENLMGTRVSFELVQLLLPLTDLEGAEQALVHAHHGARVVKLSTVVGCAEQGHQLTLGEKLVTVFDDLVGTADEVHVVFLQEPGHNVRAKSKGHTAVVFAPASDVLVRIRPEQVAKKTTVGNLSSSRRGAWLVTREREMTGDVTNISGSHDASDLLHRVQVGAEASVHSEDLLINDGGNRKTVEAIRKCLPQLDIIPAFTLIVEAVDAVDGRAFVVTP